MHLFYRILRFHATCFDKYRIFYILPIFPDTPGKTNKLPRIMLPGQKIYMNRDYSSRMSPIGVD